MFISYEWLRELTEISFSPEELPRVIANINAAASPRAQWLLADFSVPPCGICGGC